MIPNVSSTHNLGEGQRGGHLAKREEGARTIQYASKHPPKKKNKTHIVLDMIFGELRGVSARRHDRRNRILVEVLHQKGLAEGRLVVLPRAPVAVTARTNLVEERAVHLGKHRTPAARQG